MRQTHGSCVMRQTHGSCVRRQASGVPRVMCHASDSWLMRQASDSWLMCHASGVRRPMRQASGVSRPTCPIQPPPVVGHDDNRNGGISPILPPSDLRPLSCTAWGNRVVLPPAIQLNRRDYTNDNRPRRSFRSAAACCYSYEKGRHNAGLVPDGAGY